MKLFLAIEDCVRRLLVRTRMPACVVSQLGLVSIVRMDPNVEDDASVAADL